MIELLIVNLMKSRVSHCLRLFPAKSSTAWAWQHEQHLNLMKSPSCGPSRWAGLSNKGPGPFSISGRSKLDGKSRRRRRRRWWRLPKCPPSWRGSHPTTSPADRGRHGRSPALGQRVSYQDEVTARRWILTATRDVDSALLNGEGLTWDSLVQYKVRLALLVCWWIEFCVWRVRRNAVVSSRAMSVLM